MTKERSVRVSAAGIIVQDGEILRQTAAREVKEETDAEVEVERLLITAESASFKVKYVTVQHTS